MIRQGSHVFNRNCLPITHYLAMVPLGISTVSERKCIVIEIG